MAQTTPPAMDKIISPSPSLLQGSRRGSPPPSYGGGGLWPPAQTPRHRRRIPPGCMCSAGVMGQPRAPGAACRRCVSLAGEGGRGSLCAVLPRGVAGGPDGAGGRSASVRPSAFPRRATKRVSLATLRSWRAWPPYCSGWCSRVAPGRGPCVVLVHWRGFAHLSGPPREQAVGGLGACGVRAQLRPPPERRGPFGGRGDVPSASEGRRPHGPQAGGGTGGERGGGVAPWFLTPLPGGWPVAPGPVPLLLRCTPPGYICSARVAGQPRAPGAAWPAVGGSALWGGGGCQCAVPPGARPEGPAGGGGEVSLPRSVPPPSAGGHQGGSLRLYPALHAAFLGVAVPLRPTAAADTAGVSGRPTGGTRRAAALAAAVAPHPWVPRPSQGGCGAATSLAALQPSTGRGGGRGGGSWVGLDWTLRT